MYAQHVQFLAARVLTATVCQSIQKNSSTLKTPPPSAAVSLCLSLVLGEEEELSLSLVSGAKKKKRSAIQSAGLDTRAEKFDHSSDEHFPTLGISFGRGFPATPDPRNFCVWKLDEMESERSNFNDFSLSISLPKRAPFHPFPSLSFNQLRKRKKISCWIGWLGLFYGGDPFVHCPLILDGRACMQTIWNA
ncbi:uncharacterized protein LOC131238846 [Magnolia sinica]|uniref:uncharacterized protein LOC131238846 n=1 Tax=Magnolia sinica TaxID=86752 RepID=UPI00265A8D5A|nr:uncharacterized protein LOC131238846 [Magnolia sinica]